MRTARELREQARRVVLNSSCPDPVLHFRHGIEARASANAQEIKPTGEVQEQARRVKFPNSGCPNPVPHSRHGVEARASANSQELKPAGELWEQARQVVSNSTCPNPVPHVLFQVGVEVEAPANAQETKTTRELREQARSIKPEMYAAQKLTKDAHRNGGSRAERRHRHDAEIHETQVKILDDRAAKTTFRDSNKVRVHLSRG